MPDSCSFAFKASPDRPPNSGVSALDKKVDRVIGLDAEQKWGVIDHRESRKREVLRANPGKNKSDIAIDDSGHYYVLGPQEKAAGRKARHLHETVMGIIEKGARQ